MRIDMLLLLDLYRVVKSGNNRFWVSIVWDLRGGFWERSWVLGLVIRLFLTRYLRGVFRRMLVYLTSVTTAIGGRIWTRV